MLYWLIIPSLPKTKNVSPKLFNITKNFFLTHCIKQYLNSLCFWLNLIALASRQALPGYQTAMNEKQTHIDFLR